MQCYHNKVRTSFEYCMDIVTRRKKNTANFLRPHPVVLAGGAEAWLRELVGGWPSESVRSAGDRQDYRVGGFRAMAGVLAALQN